MASEITKGMLIENMMDDYQPKEGYEKVDRYNLETIEKLSIHYKEILTLIGEDVSREGLLKTPERVSKAMQFLTHDNSCLSLGLSLFDTIHKNT